MAKIKVVDFLIREINKIGVEHFFGLPGDYCFDIIDAVVANKNTAWVGCTNELNAGYAADGYARIKGYGALITTYNVGELSALNAIGGSMAENIPVIHIVGAPETRFIKADTLLHHNFCQPDYTASLNAFSYYTENSAMLLAQNAKREIERILSVFVKYKKPVYISIPKDVCTVEIEDNPQIDEPVSDSRKLEKVIKLILNIIEKAEYPLIIGDVLAERFLCQTEFNEFVEKSGLPVTTLLMGKGLINESSPYFIGTYLGSIENSDVYYQVNNTDCPICIGTILSDFNTLKFDITMKPKIEIQGTYTKIDGKTYDDVLMKDVLNGLSKLITKRDMDIIKNRPKIIVSEETEPLNFDCFLALFQEFIKENDCIFSETGVLNFFPPMLTLPDGTKWYNQLLWGAIGWATPALFGALNAKKDTRMILLTGEGAHQLTIQSVSNMLYHKMKPVIFVLNNCGYTIERMISKNPNDIYNDIIPWDYTGIIEAFGGNVWTAKAHSNTELKEIMEQIPYENQNKLCYIELFMEKMSSPYIMREMLKRDY